MNRDLRLALDRVATRVREVRLWGSLTLCWAAWAVVGVLLGAVGVQTVGILVGFAAMALASGLACVTCALRSSRDFRDVARRIEAAHPDLDAGLLTAVEEALRAPGGRLGFLQQAVVDRALDHNRSHDWDSTVPQKFIAGTRLTHLAAACGLVAILIVLGGRARSDATRPALLTGSSARTSGITVTPGDTEIEKGTSLLVVARFEGSVPPEAKLVIEEIAKDPTSHEMTRSLEDPTFAARVESVSTDLAYRIEYDGESSPSYRVSVFENPELLRTDASLEFPTYTSLEPRTVEDIRHVTAVEGTRATLRFRLNKAVASAKLVDEKGGEVVLSPPGALAEPVYTAAFSLADSHRYKLQLVDHDGRKNKLAAELGVNVTRNRPPTVTMSRPGHDVRVSPIEELRLAAQISDDFGVIRHGVSFTTAGSEARERALGEETQPRPKKVPLEHLIDFEALKATPDQLITYFVWAEDIGPDGKPRRTEGDMYFAEVRPFEEIFRQGEQPSSASAENEQTEQGAGNAQQADQLAELQKEVINGTWKVIRRETGAQPKDEFVPDTQLLRESQESVVTQAEALGERLQDSTSKANLATALKSMQNAIRLLGEASQKPAVASMPPALAAEQVAYQALLKLRAREFQVVRNNSRQQRGQRGSGAAAMQRQLDQLELTNQEDRFEEQSRASTPLTQKEREQRETRQVVNRLKELAQRQADLNERLKELQSALEAAMDEPAKQEIERQLKRLRDQQQQILRDTDELQERMENEQNRERMAEARQQVQEGRDHVRQASEALEQGRVSQALTEGTRAGEQLSDVRDDLRKQSSNQFSDDMTEMRDQAQQLAENQERLSDQIDAWKESDRPTLRGPSDRQEVTKELAQQRQKLQELVERMQQTVGEAEDAEPLLARQLFDTVREAEAQSIPEALEQTEKLANAGFAEEASKSSRQAGQGIDKLREGVERAARSVLGDETAALRLARNEVEELADQLQREIARATGEEPTRPGQATAGPNRPRSKETSPPTDQAPPGRQPRSGPAGEQGQQGESSRDPQREGASQAPGQRDLQQPPEGQGRQPGEEPQAGQRNPPGEDEASPAPEAQGAQGKGQPPPGPRRGAAPRSLRGAGSPQDRDASGAASPEGQGGDPRGEGRRRDADQLLEGFAGQPDAMGGPITGEGFREWSDRMRDVEELLEDPALRAEAARIRDRVRGVRDEFKRHSREPDWTKLKGLVAEPIVELRDRIAEEVRRRESPDSLVPIDRDPVPPQFAEGVRRYYERLGSGQ